MTLANKITIGRMVLVPVVLWAIYQGHYVLAFGVFAVAAASDGVDGYIARRFDQRTVLGSILDPLADKFLLTLSFIVLTISPHTDPLVVHPAWLTVAVAYRDLLIMAGCGVVKWFCPNMQFRPIISSKLTTLFQILTVIVVVLANLLGSLGFDMLWLRSPIHVLSVVTGMLCLISVLGYFHGGIWMLLTEGEEPLHNKAEA